MNESIWQKKIPTLFGVLLLVVGVGVTSFLVRTGVITIGRASPTEEPQNIRVTNVTDTSFSVSYTTTSLAPGVISTGNSPSLGQTVLDDRDQQSGIIGSYKTHHVTVRNLKATTKYYFSVISGKDTYLNGSQPYTVTTGTTITAPPTTQDPVTGKVVMPDGSVPKEGMLYVTVDHGQTLSVLLKPNGTYVLPMNALRDETFDSYLPFTKNTPIHMLIVNGDLKSDITLFAGQVNPVPTISLSSDYDFTQGNQPIAPVASSSAQAKFPTLPSASVAATVTPQIVTPKKDQGFSDTQPTFTGTASPNATVTITIHSVQQIQDQVKADSGGRWSYRPTTPLTPGPHTLTITTLDASGVIKTITQSFTVYASGSQVNQSATPSATPTVALPTATPTPAPLLPTATPTPIPSIAPVSPTPTPISLGPTAAVTPIAIAKGGVLTPTPQQVLGNNTTKGGTKLPAAGDPEVVIAGLAALALTGTGLLLFFLTRGSISSL